LAAVELGIDRLDCSIGGIGGCPFAPGAAGNIATEDLVYLMHRSGYLTSYNLSKISELAPWLAERLSLEHLPAYVSRVPFYPSALLSELQHQQSKQSDGRTGLWPS
jgi:hydroxymethylglutaryl-CoA lyase